jgi:hypothetical protein
MDLPNGRKLELTQAERVGPMLGGSVKVIEGRGYSPDGTLGFNAFAVLSFDPETQSYSMRSYAQGRAGDFPARVEPGKLTWEIRSGLDLIRYTIWLDEAGRWRETGERITPGGGAARFFEMTLERLGDTDWPSAGAVPAG